MKGRRFIRVTRDGAEMLFKFDGIYKIKGTLPADAKLVGIQYLANCDSIYFVFESGEWPKFAEGTWLLMQDAPAYEKVGDN